jgi:DNA-binding MarR family transcriptional regulator
MKKLIPLTFVILLSGCTLFDAYFMAKYDNNEYALANEIKTKAQVAVENCSNQLLVTTQVNELYIKSLEFKNYTLHIPRNKDAENLSTKLLSLTKDARDYFNKAEKISPVFCKAKIQQIEKSADTIQHAIGGKPR